jgi:hypothetical protein
LPEERCDGVDLSTRQAQVIWYAGKSVFLASSKRRSPNPETTVIAVGSADFPRCCQMNEWSSLT